jgi:hypothetical protein
MATFEDIPLNARSLSYRWEGHDYRLQLDPEHLSVECKSPVVTRVSKTALSDLKPDLPVEQWVSQGGLKCGRRAIACVVAATVVWFSDIRPHVPLLVPVLLLFGIQNIYWTIRAVVPRNRTSVQAENGSQIVFIPHFDRLTTQRRAFEDSLLRMVKQARGDEHQR